MLCGSGRRCGVEFQWKKESRAVALSDTENNDNRLRLQDSVNDGAIKVNGLHLRVFVTTEKLSHSTASVFIRAV